MSAFAPGSRAWPLPRWIAHRGAGKLAPENTLAAFRLGAQYGYRAFECDVKLSADGVPYLMHDATLDRTTSGSGPAADLSWDRLSRLDAGSWHGRSHAGEPLPSFEAVARYCLCNQFELDLEIKPIPGTEEHTGAVVAAEVMRLWHGEQRRPMLSTFKPAALQGAMEREPGLQRALLLDELWDGWDAAAQRLGCSAIITDFQMMDAALIQHLHARGWAAGVYTVNEPADAARMVGLGVAGIVTDAVDRFSPAAP
ncbi:MAG: glycerophosphodiester phosphodiesterase [Aquabacterium sp.]